MKSKPVGASTHHQLSRSHMGLFSAALFRVAGGAWLSRISQSCWLGVITTMNRALRGELSSTLMQEAGRSSNRR
jgi:hypothetical protein